MGRGRALSATINKEALSLQHRMGNDSRARGVGETGREHHVRLEFSWDVGETLARVLVGFW